MWNDTTHAYDTGSSPRERGALVAVAGEHEDGRLIPARAGSTGSPRGRRGATSAHPRASGEHVAQRRLLGWLFGSSPRERGALGEVRRGWRDGRLIPARAGSTIPFDLRAGASTAHPRASGEHIAPGCQQVLPCGSSPRERGARTEPARRHRPVRLIPARAGSTPKILGVIGGSPAHPRASGEHADSVQRHGRDTGSSPRERGALDRALPREPHVRLIPARAGSTAARAARRTPGPAHPRASGEHTC